MSDIVRSGAALGLALQRIGWDLRWADINLVDGLARVEVARSDGLVVTLDADAAIGRASITRERVRLSSVQVGAGGCPHKGGGRRERVERLHTVFLGRTRHTGMRSAIRSLADYIADNSDARRIDVRDAFRALLR